MFGRAAAKRAIEWCKDIDQPSSSKEIEDGIVEHFHAIRHANGTISTASLRLQMQEIMQNDCAVFRTGHLPPLAVRGPPIAVGSPPIAGGGPPKS